MIVGQTCPVSLEVMRYCSEGDNTQHTIVIISNKLFASRNKLFASGLLIIMIGIDCIINKLFASG